MFLRLTACLAACLTTPAFAAPSAGCGTTGPENGQYTLSLAGLERSYRLHLPRSYDPETPAPLILAFHGWGGDTGSFLNNRGVRRATDRADAIVIAPLGLGASEDRPSSWTFPGSATGIDGHGAATCDPSVITDETYPSCGPVGTGTAQNICSWTQCQSDDMGFVTALLDHAEATLCIDTDQVFAAGASNGGMFVWSIGQNATLAPRFRALASLIGLPHRGYLDVPANAPPILSLTARDDTTVPPGAWDDPSPTISSDGTLYHYTGATAITQRWAEAHQCDTSAPAQSIDAPFDCRSHCPTTGMFPPVLDCRMEGGHDAAPGTPGALCLISSPTSDVPLPT